MPSECFPFVQERGGRVRVVQQTAGRYQLHGRPPQFGRAVEAFDQLVWPGEHSQKALIFGQSCFDSTNFNFIEVLFSRLPSWSLTRRLI